MAKSKRKKLKDKLDQAVKPIIKLRDRNRCQKCGKYVTGSNCHVSHVIPRSKGDSLRWELQNLKVLCFHCHINWWHKNPLESGEWFKDKFPSRWEYLQERKEKTIKYTLSELEELLEYFRKKLKRKENIRKIMF